MKLSTIVTILTFLLVVGLYIKSPADWKHLIKSNTPTITIPAPAAPSPPG